VFEDTKAFGGFSVDGVPRAKEFYGETLGVRVSEEYGKLWLRIAGDRDILVYPKADHTPATYTILNFPVGDIEKAVDELAERGVRFRALRRPRHGRDGHLLRRWPIYRLVQRPRRQRLVCDPARLSGLIG
jgi:catechol 2,3-dioxygenase-like lactoylglutathione lyase family enzyme